MRPRTVNNPVVVDELLPKETANRLRGAIFSLGYESVKEAAEDSNLDYQMLIKHLNRRHVVTEAYVDQYREWLHQVYGDE